MLIFLLSIVQTLSLSAGFQVLTAVSAQRLVVSEEHVASIFRVEDGGVMFLRNVGRLSTGYTAL
jgi:hypothetical protein